MIDFVAKINEVIHEPRLKLVNQTKILLSYVFLGLVFMAIFITIIAVYTTWWLSAFVVLVYFLGLVLLQRRTGRITSEMEKAVFLNLAFTIHNLNKTLLESKFKMRCKMGHLGQWIEFHSLRRGSISQQHSENTQSRVHDEQSSDQLDLLQPSFLRTLKSGCKSQRVAPDTTH